MIVGVGMAPRGEVAMVISLLALNRGIIDDACLCGDGVGESGYNPDRSGSALQLAVQETLVVHTVSSVTLSRFTSLISKARERRTSRS